MEIVVGISKMETTTCDTTRRDDVLADHDAVIVVNIKGRRKPTHGVWKYRRACPVLKNRSIMAKAIYETRDKQLIPLDDIQHINARYNEALKDSYQTLTIMYKDGMKVTISATEYEWIKQAWEERRNGNRK